MEGQRAAEGNQAERRIFWMDAVRGLALLGIIGCHAFAFENTAMPELWENGKWFGFLSQVLFLYFSRFGVPFFLMLSGALLLRKRFDSQTDILKFYRDSLLPLFVATESWVVILHVWYYLAAPDLRLWSKDSLKVLVRDLLLWKDSLYSHMWYMREILSVYFFIPFLALAVQRLERRVLKIPFLFLFYCVAGLHTASTVWRMIFQESFYYCPDFVMFIVYMMLGCWIVKEGLFRRLPAAAFFLISCLAAAAQCMAVLYELERVDVWNQMISYSNVLILTGSVSAFVLLSRGPALCRLPGLGAAAAFVSKRSFGAYIIHFPVLIWMLSEIPALSAIPHAVVKFGVTVLLTAALSVILVQILGLAPLLRRYLVHIK